MNFIKNFLLLQYFLATVLLLHVCKHDFCLASCESLLEFATLTQGGSSYELDAARNTQSFFFFLFCIIQAASVRRLKSLPKSDIMDDRLGLNMFVLFLALETIYL